MSGLVPLDTEKYQRQMGHISLQMSPIQDAVGIYGDRFSHILAL